MCDIVADVVEWPVRIDTSLLIEKHICCLSFTYHDYIGWSDGERVNWSVYIGPFFEPRRGQSFIPSVLTGDSLLSQTSSRNLEGIS